MSRVRVLFTIPMLLGAIACATGGSDPEATKDDPHAKLSAPASGDHAADKEGHCKKTWTYTYNEEKQQVVGTDGEEVVVFYLQEMDKPGKYLMELLHGHDGAVSTVMPDGEVIEEDLTPSGGPPLHKEHWGGMMSTLQCGILRNYLRSFGCQGVKNNCAVSAYGNRLKVGGLVLYCDGLISAACSGNYDSVCGG